MFRTYAMDDVIDGCMYVCVCLGGVGLAGLSSSIRISQDSFASCAVVVICVLGGVVLLVRTGICVSHYLCCPRASEDGTWRTCRGLGLIRSDARGWASE
jgi:hypothetical protein